MIALMRSTTPSWSYSNLFNEFCFIGCIVAIRVDGRHFSSGIIQNNLEHFSYRVFFLLFQDAVMCSFVQVQQKVRKMCESVGDHLHGRLLRKFDQDQLQKTSSPSYLSLVYEEQNKKGADTSVFTILILCA